MTLDPTMGLTAIAAATLLSEDLTCIAVGLLVAAGQLGFWAGTLACFSGIVVGDLLLFAAGRTLGRAAVQRGPLRRLVSPAAFDRSSRWLERNGLAVVLLSRLMPGARLPTYVAAGALRTRALVFTGFFVLAAALWTPLLVGLAAWSGGRTAATGGPPSASQTAGLALALVVAARVVPPLFTWRGRRRALGCLRRWMHWEFWPLPLVYAPVVLWIAHLAIRHRSLTLPTAVNPGITGGGLAGESKFAILDALRPRPSLGARAADGPTSVGRDAARLGREARPYVDALDRLSRGERWLRFERIPQSLAPPSRRAAAERFMAEAGLRYPIVVKPDLGERGSQVTIARDPGQLESALARDGVDWLLQEFAPGPEFGIFYVRTPGQPRGWIFSLTEKRLPQVVGDGIRSLEALVLADDRAVCLAERYLAPFGERRNEAPAAGEVIPLVELGTHSRGAVFLDGRRLLTPELETAIDAIAQRFAGFYFGRFDVRVPSVEDLRAGRHISVLELNGLTAEPTHIYDPAVGILDAYRALFRQWQIAFEIGQRNCRSGARPASLPEICRLLGARRRARRGAPHRAEDTSETACRLPQRPATSFGQF